MPFYLDANYKEIENKLENIHNLENSYQKHIEKLKKLKLQYLKKFFG